METLYDLPSGDWVRVIDTATAATHLGAMLESFRNGGTEPLFFGDKQPDGAVISFGQWREYEALREEAADRQLDLPAHPSPARRARDVSAIGTSYELPSGERIRLVDTVTAAGQLGAGERMFFGDGREPDAVVISFEQWCWYDDLQDEVEGDRRLMRIVRERLANSKPEDWIPYEEIAREWGLDPDDRRD
jgi:hypothetical protein